MRIVSQSGTLSLNFDDFQIEVQEEIVLATQNGVSRVIGAYRTNDRAMEVFKVIHDCYSDVPIVFENDKQDEDAMKQLKEWFSKVAVVASNGNHNVEIIDNNVFYMPKE